MSSSTHPRRSTRTPVSAYFAFSLLLCFPIVPLTVAALSLTGVLPHGVGRPVLFVACGLAVANLVVARVREGQLRRVDR